ncbi:unnamed protein product [Amoebophrya sp. A25]|nr:unnamed protein product [Amoebophrya sp. A25]|eukprot:GSA25T00021769001.1
MDLRSSIRNVDSSVKKILISDTLGEVGFACTHKRHNNVLLLYKTTSSVDTRYYYYQKQYEATSQCTTIINKLKLILLQPDLGNRCSTPIFRLLLFHSPRRSFYSFDKMKTPIRRIKKSRRRRIARTLFIMNSRSIYSLFLVYRQIG